MTLVIIVTCVCIGGIGSVYYYVNRETPNKRYRPYTNKNISFGEPAEGFISINGGGEVYCKLVPIYTQSNSVFIQKKISGYIIGSSVNDIMNNVAMFKDSLTD